MAAVKPVITIVFVLIVSLIVIYAGYTEAFKDAGYNRLASFLGIANLLIGLSMIIRNYTGTDPQVVLLEIPESVKCVFGEADCEKANVTIWTVFHFIMYCLLGLYAPGYYLEVLVISFFYEIFEHHIGYQCKLVVDPIVNMAGYVLGSYIANRALPS